LGLWWEAVALLPIALVAIPWYQVVAAHWENPVQRITLITLPVIAALSMSMGLFRLDADLSPWRQGVAMVMAGLAWVSMAMCWMGSREPYGFAAIALAVASWGIGRCRADSLTHWLAVGFSLLLPVWLATPIWSNVQYWVARGTAFTTSGLMDFMVIPHVRTLSTIQTGLHSLAIDQPKLAILNVSGLIAITVGILVLMRRPWLPSVLTCLTALLWWLSTQAVQWTMVFHRLAPGDPPALSGRTEFLFFIYCVAGVIVADWFWSKVLAPIPVEGLTSDFPAISQIYSVLVDFPNFKPYIVRSNSESLTPAEENWDEDEIAIFKRTVTSKPPPSGNASSPQAADTNWARPLEE
jgi:hypothetical protein